MSVEALAGAIAVGMRQQQVSPALVNLGSSYAAAVLSGVFKYSR
jgi:hypothetical protein